MKINSYRKYECEIQKIIKNLHNVFQCSTDIIRENTVKKKNYKLTTSTTNDKTIEENVQFKTVKHNKKEECFLYETNNLNQCRHTKKKKKIPTKKKTVEAYNLQFIKLI